MNFTFPKNFPHKMFVLTHDILWVPVAVVLSYWIRFNLGSIPLELLHGALAIILIATPVHIGMLLYFGMHRGLWRFVSVRDLALVIKTVVAGILISSALLFIFHRMEGIPRSIFLLYPMFIILGMISPRVLARWIKDPAFRLGRVPGKRVLIVGAGHEGELFLRNLRHDHKFFPVGFIDSDKGLKGKEIHGVRVLGGPKEILTLMEKWEIEVVLFASLSIDSETMGFIIKQCGDTKVPCFVAPVNGKKGMGNYEYRKVTIEDLLHREEVVLNTRAIKAFLKGKRVLITGGGGSIGSELTRQIAAHEPEQLIVLDNTEFNIYQIEQSLAFLHPSVNFTAILGDIRDEIRLKSVFTSFRPEVVFHSAAFKHVPLLEANQRQAVINNIFGTKLVAQFSENFGVDRFVMVSTDKAVNPTNVMGATKRAAEIYCQSLNETSKTNFITTRFGNVMGSGGSVIPLFHDQIEKGGPITVTHPEITRYFMTIPEAVGLILQAGAMGNGGEIYVMDMGEPVKIRDLAEKMIRLAKSTEDAGDIQIVYTGLRPGEKLFEELFHEAEGLMGTSHPKLMLAQSRMENAKKLFENLSALELAADENNRKKMISVLKKIVPEFNPTQEKTEINANPSLRVV